MIAGILCKCDVSRWRGRSIATYVDGSFMQERYLTFWEGKWAKMIYVESDAYSGREVSCKICNSENSFDKASLSAVTVDSTNSAQIQQKLNLILRLRTLRQRNLQMVVETFLSIDELAS